MDSKKVSCCVLVFFIISTFNWIFTVECNLISITITILISYVGGSYLNNYIDIDL